MLPPSAATYSQLDTRDASHIQNWSLSRLSCRLDRPRCADIKAYYVGLWLVSSKNHSTPACPVSFSWLFATLSTPAGAATPPTNHKNLYISQISAPTGQQAPGICSLCQVSPLLSMWKACYAQGLLSLPPCTSHKLWTSRWRLPYGNKWLYLSNGCIYSQAGARNIFYGPN